MCLCDETFSSSFIQMKKIDCKNWKEWGKKDKFEPNNDNENIQTLKTKIQTNKQQGLNYEQGKKTKFFKNLSFFPIFE